MADLIDRQTAIETAIEAADKWDGGYSSEREGIIRKFFDKVPAVQPTCKSMYADVSDTISRQAAIDAVSEYATIWMSYTDDMSASDIAQEAINSAKDTMIRILKEQPAVQPEPHEGHWIGGDGSYICSECGSNPIDFIDTMGASFDAYVGTLMNYCPNCGAKMKGEQNE